MLRLTAFWLASSVPARFHCFSRGSSPHSSPANPCVAVEFPVSIKKSTRKPHYMSANMSATEQAKIEIAAPSYLRNIVVIVSELGLRYKKELLPRKKEQVHLEN